MTKAELLELMKDIPDDANIGAWWDDCEWKINGIRVAEEDQFDFVIECP